MKSEMWRNKGHDSENEEEEHKYIRNCRGIKESKWQNVKE